MRRKLILLTATAILLNSAANSKDVIIEDIMQYDQMTDEQLESLNKNQFDKPKEKN